MDIQRSSQDGVAAATGEAGGAVAAAANTKPPPTGSGPASHQQAVDSETRLPRPWPGTGPDASQVAESVCYVCELAGMPGKFDPKCAAALGVPKGPVSGKFLEEVGGGKEWGDCGTTDILHVPGHLRCWACYAALCTLVDCAACAHAWQHRSLPSLALLYGCCPPELLACLAHMLLQQSPSHAILPLPAAVWRAPAWAHCDSE